MRTTLSLDDELLKKAKQLTGIDENPTLRPPTRAAWEQRARALADSPSTVGVGMILVDTSVWIDHLRSGDAMLTALLDEERVLAHPFVIGELALGSMRNRQAVLDALHGLPIAVTATDEEVLRLIDSAPLHGLGIGYVDAHLLAAVRLTEGCTLWTRDNRLQAAAEKLQLAACPTH
ncbi:hypothetical protein DFQ28_011152 [Apophysomyces sp. BC1034]|nr:hypothetical protein DFQ28_011152 [Apophysomyces sp. BC1034]